MNRSDASLTCPASDCEYGPDGGRAVFRAATMPRAIKFRDEHLRSAHPGYKPPTGSIQDRRHRLD